MDILKDIDRCRNNMTVHILCIYLHYHKFHILQNTQYSASQINRFHQDIDQYNYYYIQNSHLSMLYKMLQIHHMIRKALCKEGNLELKQNNLQDIPYSIDSPRIYIHHYMRDKLLPYQRNLRTIHHNFCKSPLPLNIGQLGIVQCYIVQSIY